MNSASAFVIEKVYNGIELDESICYSEDYATSPRLVYNSNKVAYLKKTCYYYLKNIATSYTASVSVKSIKSLERAALLLEDFFLKINLEYYAPVLSLAKVYVKVHSMKSSFYNEEAFKYSISLFKHIGGDKLNRNERQIIAFSAGYKDDSIAKALYQGRITC